MAFVWLANFIGFPALSVVNGYDEKSGLPTALQVMSRQYCEEDALFIGSLVEAETAKAKPQVYYDLLRPAK